MIHIVSLLINVIDFDLFIPIYIIRLYVVMIQLLSNSINGTIFFISSILSNKPNVTKYFEMI